MHVLATKPSGAIVNYCYVRWNLCLYFGIQTVLYKLLIYKTTPKPIWTYGIPLWGTASNSNIEILQGCQNKILRATVNAPWYTSNKAIYADIKVPTIREEITKFSFMYRDKITTHPNERASTLLEEEETRRLKRFKPTDLTTRYS